jgi:catechol 2,3-dioxygenase-like lactoylglutathione lyase family enzyme
MFARVTVTASDLAASRSFYETVLAVLPGEQWDVFAVEAGEPTRHLHVAFAAVSPADVDRFWQAGVEAGYASDGEPGPRPQYTPDYYGGFLLDPDGNSIEAVHRPGRTETGSRIDHLWLGVDDLDASRATWDQIAPELGLEVEEGSRPGYVFVTRDRRHLALVDDGRPPAENVGIAITGLDGSAREVL